MEKEKKKKGKRTQRTHTGTHSATHAPTHSAREPVCQYVQPTLMTGSVRGTVRVDEESLVCRKWTWMTEK